MKTWKRNKIYGSAIKSYEGERSPFLDKSDRMTHEVGEWLEV